MVEIAVAIVVTLVAGAAYLTEKKNPTALDTIICVGICQHTTAEKEPAPEGASPEGEVE